MSNSAEKLEPGDFLYQSDQELFLCVTNVEDNSISFAVHGWREIDKERVEDYIDSGQSRLHSESRVESLVEDKGDDDAVESFEALRELFDAYQDIDIAEDGPPSDYALDETS